jgi:Rieske Fe-S protein
MAALLTSTVVTGLAPILVFLWPAPPKGQKKTPIKVSLTKAASDIQNGEAIQFFAPKIPNSAFVMTDGGGDNAPGDLAFGGFLVKDNSGKLNALALNCSHLGCSIGLNAPAGSFDCPCHGSRFHLDGTVLRGPAAYPLSHLKWEQDTSDPNTINVDGIILGF